MTDARLYLVATPRRALTEDEFLARIKAALDGGVDILQLRCKECDALPYLRLAERVLVLARDAGVPFVVNDRPDIARAAGADGVHLGQTDLPVAEARQILRAGAIIGRSSHEPSHAHRAIEERTAYFAVGPVWETPTKPGRPAAGLAYVRDVARIGPSIPWFAIGGITPANVGEVIEAGATRVAVVRAILDAPDPAASASALASALSAGTMARAPNGGGVRR